MVFFVIAIIIFGPAAVFPWSPGAVASATHANVSKNGTQEYSLVAENLSFVQAAISGAVTNITGENFSQTQAVISGMVTNVTGGTLSHSESLISGAVVNGTKGSVHQIQAGISGAVANVTGV